MLKTKITKEEHEKLPDALKEHYSENNGSFLLQADEAEALRRAKERSDTEAAEAKAERDRLKAEKEESDRAKAAAEEDAAKKKGDVAALEASWKTKEETSVAAERKRTETREAQLKQLLVKDAARALANEISTAPDLILPHIEARLSADLSGDTPLTRVLDSAGKPSAQSVKDLGDEFVANTKFAAIIKGTGGSGGGAGGNNGGGAPGAKKISEMSEAERVAFAKTNPTGFKEQANREGVSIPH